MGWMKRGYRKRRWRPAQDVAPPSSQALTRPDPGWSARFTAACKTIETQHCREKLGRGRAQQRHSPDSEVCPTIPLPGGLSKGVDPHDCVMRACFCSLCLSGLAAQSLRACISSRSCFTPGQIDHNGMWRSCARPVPHTSSDTAVSIVLQAAVV
jgi:hypothetical protein